MPSSRRPRGESIPPRLTPAQAIPLIRRQIERLDEIVSLPHDNPKRRAWESTTETVLNDVFGQPDGAMHDKTARVIHASGGPLYMDMSEREQQIYHVKQQENRRALLEAYIEDLETLTAPTPPDAPSTYRWHSEIERASAAAYRGGLYREAVMNACIRVINEVKRVSRTGDSLDGDRLMNRAFSCERQIPIIQFNPLATQADHDEQMGLLYLYKGLVGLRNSKAHSIVPLDDPVRAYEYLAFTSLLLRLLEVATVNSPNSPPTSP